MEAFIVRVASAGVPYALCAAMFFVATACDVVTGWIFRMTVTETSLPEQTARIARLRFSMYFALGCWLAWPVEAEVVCSR